MNAKTRTAAMVSHWLNGSVKLHQHLGGEYIVGVALLNDYVDSQRGQTVDGIVAQLEGTMSDDTVRRKLNSLVAKGIATVGRDSRVTFYQLKPEVAERALQIMRGED